MPDSTTTEARFTPPKSKVKETKTWRIDKKTIQRRSEEMVIVLACERMRIIQDQQIN